MINEGPVIGHGMKSDYQMADFMIPKNLDDTRCVIISTAWDSKAKRGETLKIYIPEKSFWDLSNSPQERLAQHKRKRDAIRFHKKIVTEMRK